MVDLVDADSSGHGSVWQLDLRLAVVVEHERLGPALVEKVALRCFRLLYEVRAVWEFDAGESALGVCREGAYHRAWFKGRALVHNASLGCVGDAHLTSLKSCVALRSLRTKVDVYLYERRSGRPFHTLIYHAGVRWRSGAIHSGNANPIGVELVALWRANFSQLIGAVGKDPLARRTSCTISY